MSNFRKFLLLFLILGVLILFDTIGYMLIEEVGLFDALYMTVISITTVGYTEVFQLSARGRLFTIWVIISGLGTFFYIIGKIAETTFEGNIRTILGRRKMKMLLNMKDHVIVAGFGRMGEHVCRELCKMKIKFVIIENDNERFALAEELEYSVINEDATSEEALRRSGVEKAKTFISLLASDADNIFTVMAVREVNPTVCIISRALDTANEKRLYRVGANRVVTPYELSSRRIVNTVLRPNVVDMIDLMTYSPKMAISIEELTIKDDSPFAAKRIIDSGLRQNYNAIVIAIKRKEAMIFNPNFNQEILPGDILILVGEKDKLLNLY
ncbi:MAG: potassium channel protein [Candidatus Aminicenantes bacterium]|nr:MAG: potassium channel protein [Candidatus Aminicenantes bacterium]